MSEREEIRHTTCRLCSACCPITVRVREGRIVSASLKHGRFLEAGYLCPKLQQAAEIVYSERRVLSPLYRPGGDRDKPWRRIGWDHALGIVSERLTRIKNEYGPQSLCWLRGQAADWGSPWHYAMRFMHAFGSPNAIGNGSVCHAAREMQHVYTYGAMTSADYGSTRCMVIWGKNERNTKPLDYDALLRARERGAALIVIDPVRTELALRADIWLALNPGCDGILALSMMHTIITEKLYDSSFVGDWTVGFEQLQEVVQKYDPQRVASRIGLQAERIVEAARLYAGSASACIAEGNGLDMSLHTSQNTRAVCILRALTGNLDRKGGDLLPSPVPFRDIRLAERLDPRVPNLAYEYPLFNSYHRDRGIQTLGPLLEAIVEQKPYPIKAMIIQAANPAVTSVNTGRFFEALDKLELVVVIDMLETKTAAAADLLLPTCSCFERTQLNLSSLSDRRVRLQDRVIEPLGLSRPDWRIVFDLARALGYEKEFPWRSVEQVIDEQLEPAGITVAALRREADGITVSELKYGKYRQGGFATESGKVELYCRAFADHGYQPLPDFDLDHPPNTGNDEPFPYTAMSGERPRYFVHSQLRHIEALREAAPEPLVDLNPVDAAREGITEGDTIRIESVRGSIRMKARIGERVRPGFLRIAWGWGELSQEYDINALTDDRLKDPVTSTTSNRTFACRITRVE